MASKWGKNGSSDRFHFLTVGFPGGSVVKKPPSRAGDTGDVYLITELRRSPGGGNGNPLQYSC